MTIENPLQHSTLRFVATYSVAFLGSVMLLGALTYEVVERTVEAELRERVVSSAEPLLIDYREDGLEELRHDVSERLEASTADRLHYYLQNAEGRVIFDDMDRLPTEQGWHRIQTPSDDEILLKVHQLDDGYVLGIAANLEPLETLESAVTRRIGIVVALAVLLGVAGAGILWRRNVRRLEAFSKMARSVGEGELGNRLVPGARDQEFTALADIINRMLDRIELVVKNNRRVTSNIAHDLRTPLGRLRQKLEAHRDEGGASAEELEVLLAELDQVLDTFSAILRISEIESSTRTSEFSRVDLSEVVDRVLDAYAPLCDAASLEVHTDLRPGTLIHGDRELLAQLLTNLVENAVAHSGGTRLDITVDRAADGPRLRVRDNGQGVDETALPRITEPFFKADASRSQSGSGLGLSMVKATAQLHGADLRFDTPDGGLAVTLTFSNTPPASV